MPLLPGAVTASRSHGAAGTGLSLPEVLSRPNLQAARAYLSSLSQPIPQVKFCPTGGITPALAPSYLKLANVITLGGSWMAPKAMVDAGDWAGIEKLAREAAAEGAQISAFHLFNALISLHFRSFIAIDIAFDGERFGREALPVEQQQR